MIQVRNYNPDTDYPAVSALYQDSSTFGGQFDETRDSKDRLRKLVGQKEDAILVAEKEGKIVGTVTLFEDARSAWLYRFAVESQNDGEVAQALWESTKELLKQKGHSQVLVYAPAGNAALENRYRGLGFTKGNDFTAYWQDLA